VAELFRAESSRLFNAARVVSQDNRADAEDLVQKVFEAAAVNWDDLRSRSESSRRQWLHAVLRKRAIDRWRAERHILLEPQLLDIQLGTHTSDDPSLSVVTADTAALIWEKLRVLPSAQYRVAYLDWALGWTTREIADELGISQTTVRVHRRNALERIREMSGDLPEIS
jgi:RNA polymerase sigma-70 factor (ECF subfamily)